MRFNTEARTYKSKIEGEPALGTVNVLHQASLRLSSVIHNKLMAEKSVRPLLPLEHTKAMCPGVRNTKGRTRVQDKSQVVTTTSSYSTVLRVNFGRTTRW